MTAERKISREGAAHTIQRLFKDATDDYVSVEQIFTNVGREQYDLKKNRNWLYNVLSTIKSHGFVEKVSGVENGARVTKGLRLTSEGQRAMQEIPAVRVIEAKLSIGAGEEVSFSSVRADVKKLRERFPEFDITFDARLKEEDA